MNRNKHRFVSGLMLNKERQEEMDRNGLDALIRLDQNDGDDKANMTGSQVVYKIKEEEASDRMKASL